VADFTSLCALRADTVWRFASHIIGPVFVASEVPLLLSVNAQLIAGREQAEAKRDGP
jgi:hypothetical protein